MPNTLQVQLPLLDGETVAHGRPQLGTTRNASSVTITEGGTPVWVRLHSFACLVFSAYLMVYCIFDERAALSERLVVFEQVKGAFVPGVVGVLSAATDSTPAGTVIVVSIGSGDYSFSAIDAATP